MKTRNLTLTLIPVAGSLLVFILGYLLHLFWSSSVIHKEPLHSTTEAIGALASILMGIVLLQRQSLEGNYKFLWLIAGLFVMGVLDGFHAIVAPGNNFVLLHSSSVFFGGVFFSFMWFSEVKKTTAVGKRVLWLIVLAFVLLSSWILSFPETMPLMLHNGKFTPVAIFLIARSLSP